MSLCRYNTSKLCENHGTSSRTCLDCVLDEIRAEIEEEYEVESEHPYGQGLRKALQIIDKYKEGDDE